MKYKICRVGLYVVIGNDFFNMNCVTLDVVSRGGGYGESKNTLGFNSGNSYSNVLPGLLSMPGFVRIFSVVGVSLSLPCISMYHSQWYSFSPPNTPAVNLPTGQIIQS